MADLLDRVRVPEFLHEALACRDLCGRQKDRIARAAAEDCPFTVLLRGLEVVGDGGMRCPVLGITGRYVVTLDRQGTTLACSCPDFVLTTSEQLLCKHCCHLLLFYGRCTDPLAYSRFATFGPSRSLAARRMWQNLDTIRSMYLDVEQDENEPPASAAGRPDSAPPNPDEDCPICFVPFGKERCVRCAPCGNHFHRDCAARWAGSCPMCRDPGQFADLRTWNVNTDVRIFPLPQHVPPSHRPTRYRDDVIVLVDSDSDSEGTAPSLDADEPPSPARTPTRPTSLTAPFLPGIPQPLRVRWGAGRGRLRRSGGPLRIARV